MQTGRFPFSVSLRFKVLFGEWVRVIDVEAHQPLLNVVGWQTQEECNRRWDLEAQQARMLGLYGVSIMLAILSAQLGILGRTQHNWAFLRRSRLIGCF